MTTSLLLAPHWLAFQVEKGDYDVEVTEDPATLWNPTGQRKLWRYQLNGPNTQAILEKAVGSPIGHVGFFRMTEFSIAGTPVRALNHTMAGVPGKDYTGLEMFGPVEHGPQVLNALLEAGAEFGMRRGGSVSYLSSAHESGWIPLVVPAIYTHPELQDYRERTPSYSMEASLPLEGSFESDNIEDYYAYPWDLGYGRVVKFDHDFIGRSALEGLADAPHRQKVWLHWNEDDVARLWRDSMFGQGDRPKVLSLPNLNPGTIYYDAVRHGDDLIGASTWGGYTANIGGVVTLGMVDQSAAHDGAQVEITWGEPDGGQGRALMRPHVQTTVRATVHTKPPA